MNRLKELRRARNLTQVEVAKFIGISQNNYSYWENDKVKIDNESLQRLADFFETTVDYILGRDEKSAPVKERKGVLINVYGEIAAGIPIEAIEDILDQEEITKDMAATGEFIALRIKGTSMEPRIMDGDVVIIRIQEDVENNEIAAVFVNGNEVTLKRIKKEENGIWLMPNNPAFTPIFYSKKECAELPVRILGKMVELRAKF